MESSDDLSFRNYVHPHFSTMLVRSVSEPSSLAIFLLALFSLLTQKIKKKV